MNLYIFAFAHAEIETLRDHSEASRHPSTHIETSYDMSGDTPGEVEGAQEGKKEKEEGGRGERREKGKGEGEKKKTGFQATVRLPTQIKITAKAASSSNRR